MNNRHECKPKIHKISLNGTFFENVQTIFEITETDMNATQPGQLVRY